MNLVKSHLVDTLARFRPDAFPYARFALALLIGSVGGALFAYAHLPLPWMLGAMVACTVAALLKLKVAAPPIIRPPMLMVIGVMMGASFTPQLFVQMGQWWPATLGLLAFLALSGSTSVWYFQRFGQLDRTTSFFSGMPGGLVEMIERGEEQGGDGRTIALVHTVRILLIVMTLPFVIQWITGISLNRAGGSVSMFDTPLWDELVLLCCGLAGMALGHVLRLPAKYLLGPMLASAVVHMAGWTELRPPFEIINFAQLILGVVIGCRFVGTSTSMVLRILKLSLGSTVILLFWTFLFSVLIGRWIGIEPVTVVLAFAPGGLAEMSLIALALHAEVAFVSLHHIIRLMLVMLFAAPIFNLLNRLAARKA
jgi:membrane AbrB-like protein